MFQEYAKRGKLINMNKVINIQTEDIFDKYVDLNMLILRRIIIQTNHQQSNKKLKSIYFEA